MSYHLPDKNWSFKDQIVHLNCFINLLILHDLIEEIALVCKQKVGEDQESLLEIHRSPWYNFVTIGSQKIYNFLGMCVMND